MGKLSNGEITSGQNVTIYKWSKSKPIIGIGAGMEPINIGEIPQTTFQGEPFEVLAVTLPYVLLKPIDRIAVLERDIPFLIYIDTRDAELLELEEAYVTAYKSEIKDFKKSQREHKKTQGFQVNPFLLKENINDLVQEKEENGWPFKPEEE